MLKRNSYTFALCALLLAYSASGQALTSRPHVGVEQVPLDDAVYAYLRHLSVRGLIEGYSEAELPLSEYEIAEFLRHAKEMPLTKSENEQLAKYLRTFAHEPPDVITWF